MKFTQISTMALAAMMAFSSCSKEEIVATSGADLQPGEAQIVLDLGRKGATTYSTMALEKAIVNGGAKLFYASAVDGHTIGESIPLSKAEVAVVEGNATLTATVPATAVSTGANAKFIINLNATTAEINEGTEGTDEAKFLAASVAKALSLTLATGAPAGIISNSFTLATGTITVTAPSAKRAIARVAVSNVSEDALSIAGFKIASANVNMTSGMLFAGINNGGSAVAGTEALSYDVVETGLEVGGIAANTGGKETVAYLYPSKDVLITVTSPAGETRTVTFSPKANMNYTIKINPMKPTTGQDVSFSVSIDSNWVDDGDLDADFNTTLKLKSDFASGNASIVNGALEIKASSGTTTIPLADLITLNPALTKYVILVSPREATRAGAITASAAITDGNLVITHPVSYGDQAVLLDASFASTDQADSNAEILRFTIKIANPLPAGFIANMGDNVARFMALNTSGVLATDIALFKKINATTGDSFGDKMIAYMKVSVENYQEVVGKRYDTRVLAEAACPKGFKLPTQEQFKPLIGDVFNTGSNEAPDTKVQYNAAVLDVYEQITNDGAIVETAAALGRKVGSFTSGFAAGGNLANKSYRVFQYNDEKLVLSVSPSKQEGTEVSYGGIFCKVNNIGINGAATSKTMYTQASVSAFLNVRCIVDTDAANVVW